MCNVSLGQTYARYTHCMCRCSLLSMDYLMIDPVFRSNPLDYCQGPVCHPSHPSLLTPSLILSLIFPTWVMALVIPNDSRNKSAVMRSHWVRFFLSLKSPFTAPYNHPVPETQAGFGIRAPANQRETDQFLPPPCSQNGHPVLLSISLVFFFPISKTYYLLTQWSSYPSLMLMLPARFSKPSLMTPSAYLLIYLAFLVCVCVYLRTS